ncbi:hypothetical protein [Anaerosporobacter sp.]
MNEWQVKLMKQLPKDYDTVVLGDECCIHKALHEKWFELLIEAVNNGVKVRFVTPMVPDKYCTNLYEYLQKMITITKLKVTFNDYGFLYMCKDLILENRIVPVIGRVLTRSLLDCSWHSKLLEGEEEALIEVLQKHSFLESEKISLMKELGVEEIELNWMTYKDVKYLKEHGLKCTCYVSNNILSMGRVCYSSKWYEMNVPECVNDDRCYNRLNIELEKTWGKERLMYENATEEMKEYFESCYVEGNAIFKNTGLEVDDIRLADFDRVIVTEK